MTPQQSALAKVRDKIGSTRNFRLTFGLRSHLLIPSGFFAGIFERDQSAN
jgi:hypothetical protein